MSYKITIKQGNIVKEENAGLIVNASNTKLLLGSGVSMAFKKHCGVELQNEMTDLLHSVQCVIEQGDVCLSIIDNIPNFKVVLHAIVMNYNKGINQNSKAPTLETIKIILEGLESYLYDYYKIYPEKDTRKLVLPLLGCGVGGLNKSDVINIYKNFFNRTVDIDCEVVIYGYTKADYELILKLIEAIL